ncbi:phosphatase PAP2 family protein [Ornithobacterium rhinotracheale]|uniref:phosphatase PAP2 family protein n=1 Tax=Ornithobacterium rhinotracheale TaxID=28251 RepID=UPI00129C1B20|nr:phosphatase PAP2 family protein [Ornithobacterium rhinotracheale]MRJ08156.1 phosphatase PAP2 family protein [Ornithobacterium rhinotracheale]UOH77354.1 phosphatase PAP2 family protein [Ornithobacterium rhinotracheale]
MQELIHEIVTQDQQLLIYLNNLGSPTWDEFWLFITDKYTFIPLYLILLVLIYKIFDTKKLILVLILLGLGITMADQLSNLFKNVIFMRLRPCFEPLVTHYIRHVKPSCGGRYGFFSAHAANTFVVATYLGAIFKKKFKALSIFLIIWAVFVSYSRIYIGVHYPLDILVGAFFGGVIGYAVYKVFLYFCSTKYFQSKG